jgi:hypothetical protein
MTSAFRSTAEYFTNNEVSSVNSLLHLSLLRLDNVSVGITSRSATVLFLIFFRVARYRVVASISPTYARERSLSVTNTDRRT